MAPGKIDTSTHEFYVAVVAAFDRLGNKAGVGKELGVGESTIRRALIRAAAAGVRSRPKARPEYADGQIIVVAQGDLHDSPNLEDKSRFEWIGRMCADVQPDYFVDIGDSMTMDSCNSHIPNESIGGKCKPTFLEDITSIHAAWSAFDAECPENVIRLKTRGNHEHRLYAFEERTPEVAGMMQFEYERMLTRHGFTETEYGEVMFIGGVGFVHVPLGETGKPTGGKTAETRIANDLLHDLVFGHSHKRRHHRAPKIGDNQWVEVLNLGCGLPQGHVEDYARLSQTGWWHGTNKLTIEHGHIQSVEAVTMDELQRRYS